MRNLISYFSILVVLCLLASCSPNNQPNQQSVDQYGNMQYQNQQTDDNYRGLDSPPNQFNITSNAEAQEVAERLVTLASKMDKVNDATAVVVGRFAVVGIDVDANLERSEVGTVKYSVAEALKADPMGAYAIVTADVDTNQRLREMNKDIREGKPIQGIMEELADIVGRLMPQVPRTIEEPARDQGGNNVNQR